MKNEHRKVKTMRVLLNTDLDFYNHEGELVILTRGTEVFVDANEGIAYHTDNYFFIDRHEYTTIN